MQPWHLNSISGNRVAPGCGLYFSAVEQVLATGDFAYAHFWHTGNALEPSLMGVPIRCCSTEEVMCYAVGGS